METQNQTDFTSREDIEAVRQLLAKLPVEESKATFEQTAEDIGDEAEILN